jgi:chemotaxis protein MotB
MEGTPIIIKKKKAHGHAHHGGSWKVAYADFVTAMMAFFMVMWILGLSDESKSQISGYFNDPLGYSKTAPLSRNIVKFPGAPATGGTIKQQVGKLQKQQKLSIVYLLKKIKQAIAEASAKGVQGEDGKMFDVKELAKHLIIEQDRDGVRIEFREGKNAVFFESGSSEIRPAARALIRRLAPILSKEGQSIKIEGHTDAVPYAQSGYDNWDLSGDRANAMRRVLMSGGFKPKLLLGVEGFAETKLRDAEHPTSPVNRRVSILIPTLDVETAERIAITEGPDIREDISLTPEIDLTRPKAVTKPDSNRNPRNALGIRAH